MGGAFVGESVCPTPILAAFYPRGVHVPAIADTRRSPGPMYRPSLLPFPSRITRPPCSGHLPPCAPCRCFGPWRPVLLSGPPQGSSLPWLPLPPSPSPPSPMSRSFPLPSADSPQHRHWVVEGCVTACVVEGCLRGRNVCGGAPGMHGCACGGGGGCGERGSIRHLNVQGGKPPPALSISKGLKEGALGLKHGRQSFMLLTHRTKQ